MKVCKRSLRVHACDVLNKLSHNLVLLLVFVTFWMMVSIHNYWSCFKQVWQLWKAWTWTRVGLVMKGWLTWQVGVQMVSLIIYEISFLPGFCNHSASNQIGLEKDLFYVILAQNTWFFVFLSFAFRESIIAACLCAMWFNTRAALMAIFAFKTSPTHAMNFP